MRIIRELRNLLALNSFRNMYGDSECIIVGNGPSVEVNDLKLIQNSGKVIFTFNRFYLAYEQLELEFFRPDFIMSIDPQMIKDFGQDIIDNRNDATVFFGMNNRNALEGEYISFYIKNRIPFLFQKTPFNRISTGDSSVIAAIQMAYFMGMKKIYLYGVDHNFKHDIKSNDGMVKGGSNHFIKDYRSGRKWHPPVSENIELAFKACDKYLRERDGYIVNCSRRTKLDNIERMNLNDCL
ncbi:6-hydroxymethylpterin diphosphokinase MptE-like protein [Vibrio sp. SCSIO 43137]|uniref:6-hydroxymethylpterin diphosphokinase MptE-like protein n=1 Tax=Vibrio sp. SCSIO 43137 TaxID=3021011 RepID=UPI002307B22D|nr:6-hydroxymethylpterin diphosphokinase MptE-like protein [Vibrio sp. SCSIO 43137]WCE29872.1 DUF115 domain-containing protein [Vibrio sp. SCSIO 43137]